MNCTAWNTTTPPLYSVAIRCIHYDSDNAISLDPDLNSKHNRLVGVGFMCFLLVVAGLASCFMWVPCYHIIDDRVKEAVEMAQAGQGVGTRIFDKSDCANPCRGCFKIIVLAVMTPCECRTSEHVAGVCIGSSLRVCWMCSNQGCCGTLSFVRSRVLSGRREGASRGAAQRGGTAVAV